MPVQNAWLAVAQDQISWAEWLASAARCAVVVVSLRIVTELLLQLP